jgi:hypothetical protein
MGASIVAAILISGLLVAISSSTLGSSAPPGWRTYTDPDYGFRISYPSDMTYFSGRPDYKEISLLSYIPVCDWQTVACFVYNVREHNGIRFAAAGFSVNVLRDLRTEAACSDSASNVTYGRRFSDSSNREATTVINGRRFSHYPIGEAATGNFLGGDAYRTFYDNVCFEVTAAIAGSGSGTPEAVDRGQSELERKKVDAEFRTMLGTLEFVGPVRDGAGWRVYHNSMVGGTFEYPEGDTVVKSVEYSQQRYYSEEITDSVFFKDHGLTYTVATKVNLPSELAFSRWLQRFSPGYPDLSKATVLKRSGFYTEYKAGPYYYVFGQATVYILTVSDGKRVISPERAPVFRHFLNSFRAS